MSIKLDIMNRVYNEGVVAIMRANSPKSLLQAAQAIHAGGLSVIEVTMTTPDALDVIRQAAGEMADRVCIGAGSVLDAETARAAILAGAKFIVTPVLDIGVIRTGNRYSVPVMMGCYTPTEAKVAWEEGADAVKLFPATQGGLSYMKALQAPLPQIDFIPTGGVNLDNAAAFLHAGAFALGVGSALVSGSLLESGDFDEITRRASAFRAITREFRAQAS